MQRDPDRPRLLLHPRAWLKWQFLCHAGPTEIGAFGRSDPNHLLYVEDLIVPKQTVTATSVAFDDLAVAEMFETLVDEGLPPRQFARIWLHTHPGASVEPSGVDEATFRRVFGGCDWAVMAILGRTGRTSCRLRFNTGPGGAIEIVTAVDWPLWPEYARWELPLEIDEWQRDYEQLVEPVPCLAPDPRRVRETAASPFAIGLEAWLQCGELFDPNPTRTQHDGLGDAFAS